MSTVFIATLGTESQVVTLSLLELDRLGFAVDEVVIIHTAGQDPKIIEALTRLRQAFAQTEWLQRYRHRFEILQGRTGPIADITTAAEAEDVFNEIFRVVRNYKLDGYRLHLNIAGGRKPMSIYGMVTAQMLFDENDYLWHLVSNDALVQSRRLFPQPGDEYQLVPIPLIRATDRPDVLRQIQNAQEAVQEQEALRRDTEIELFLARLTPKQRKVTLLLGQGYTNEEIAGTLGRKVNTITKHISVIYKEWRIRFALPENAPIRGAIVAALQGYLIRKREVTTQRSLIFF